MKAKKLFFGLFCLGALVLGACSGNKASSSAPAPSSSGSEPAPSSSEPAHEHVWDEHGLCSCGEYRGQTKAATQADPLTLTDVVAGTEYYFRLQVEKNVRKEMNASADPKFDATKTKVWIKEGSNWLDVGNEATCKLSNDSDGYLYFKYVSTEALATISIWVQTHEHSYIDAHGFCNMCGEYIGSELQLNLPFVIESTVANKWYYCRLTGIDPMEIYKLFAETTELDGSAIYECWGSTDNQTFVPYDAFYPTEHVGETQLYFAFHPSIAGYQATFTVTLAHDPDETGFCKACGEYLGELCTVDAVYELKDFDEGVHYFRFEATKDDIDMLTFGNGFAFNGLVSFYTRTQEGVVTNINQYVNRPFLIPELPDGYLYVKVEASTDQIAPQFGLLDVTSYGETKLGFAGEVLDPQTEHLYIATPNLVVGQRAFFKLPVYTNHCYKFVNKADFTPNTELKAYYHAEDDSYVETNTAAAYSAISKTGTVGGKVVDYMSIVIEPTATHLPTEIEITISHAWESGSGNIDEMCVCKLDGAFTGNEMINNKLFEYDFDDSNSEYYRFKLESGKSYQIVSSNLLTDDHWTFKRSLGDHLYAAFEWDGSTKAAASFPQSADGYIYLKLSVGQEVYAGNLKLVVTE